MYGYIYKTTNMINGLIYIGQHKGIFDSLYKGSGVLLKREIEKYGKNQFKTEILEYCETKEILNERERYWISNLKSQLPNIGYNITSGGTGGLGFNWSNFTPEEIQIIHEKSAKGFKEWAKTEKGHLIMSRAQKEMHKNRPDFVINHVNAMKQWRKNNPIKAKENSRKAIFKAQEAKRQKVVCLDTLEEFNSIEEAVKLKRDETHKIRSSKISDCCRNCKYVHGGLHWAYKDDYINSIRDDNQYFILIYYDNSFSIIKSEEIHNSLLAYNKLRESEIRDKTIYHKQLYIVDPDKTEYWYKEIGYKHRLKEAIFEEGEPLYD